MAAGGICELVGLVLRGLAGAKLHLPQLARYGPDTSWGAHGHQALISVENRRPCSWQSDGSCRLQGAGSLMLPSSVCPGLALPGPRKEATHPPPAVPFMARLSCLSSLL